MPLINEVKKKSIIAMIIVYICVAYIPLVLVKVPGYKIIQGFLAQWYMCLLKRPIISLKGL